MLTPRALRVTWLLLLAALAGWAGGSYAGQPREPAAEQLLDEVVVASAGWPPSSGLLVAEVVTRGDNAADQYVEIYNAAPMALELSGLELVYVTASGATVTRKQAWTGLSLEPGHHLLIANAGGSYASQADGLFSNGGFSTTGGSLVLRMLGGNVIDTLSWGTAASAFVEGTAAPAPPTGSSLERLPGGDGGNAVDTNDNLADTRHNPAPAPRNLAAGPVAAPPSATASPQATHSETPPVSATPAATATPAPTDSPSPSDYPYEGEPSFTDEWPPDPTPTPTPQQTAPATGTPEPTLPATIEPTAALTPTAAPTPTATPTPPPPTMTPSPTPPPTTAPPATPTVPPEPTTPAPTATPTAGPVSIGQARDLPTGSRVTIVGTLTTAPGLTESGKGAFIQDETAGIAIYLAGGGWPALTLGEAAVVSGVIETRFSLLTIRLAETSDIVRADEPPAPVTAEPLNMGEIAEAVEARLVTVEGVITEGQSSLSDGYSTTISDDSGSVRVVVATSSGIVGEALARGSHVRVTGVVGQRDSSGTGVAGYRIHPRQPSDIEALAMPTQAPTPSPSPAPTPTRRPDPTPTRTPQPTRTPAPTPTDRPASSPRPARLSIAAALRRSGETVTVEGVVTAPAALLDADARRLTMQDATGALLVRLPVGASAPRVGSRMRITGAVGTYYGAPQLAAESEPELIGQAAVRPRGVERAPLPATLEWQLITVTGVVKSVQRSGDAWRAEIEVPGGAVPVVGLARSGIASDALVAGRRATVVGLVRRAYPTAVDQRFAVVPRSTADVRLGAPVSSSPGAASPGTPGSGGSGGPAAPVGSGSGSGAPAGLGSGSPGAVVGSAIPDRSPGAVVTVLDSLADLAGYDGLRVRVGGLIVHLDGTRVVISDDSGSATVVMVGAAESQASEMVVGGALNATGIVGRDARGAVVLTVSEVADLVHRPPSGATPPPATASSPRPAEPGPSSGATSPPAAEQDGANAGSPAATIVGLLALLGLVTGSAGVLLRSRRQRLVAWIMRLVRRARP